MAANTDPIFVKTLNIGHGSVSVANTGRDGTGTLVTCFTAGANGSRLDEVVLKASDNPADSIVTMFLYDGTNNRIFDEFDLNDPAAGSTTVPTGRWRRRYEDGLFLPTGFLVKFAITVALTAGNIEAWCMGGDY